MKNIEIAINNGRIESFSVQLEEDLPVVSASIALYAGEKKITAFSLSSQSWHSERFDVPISMISPIKKLASELERIIVNHCKSQLAELPAGETGQ